MKGLADKNQLQKLCEVSDWLRDLAESMNDEPEDHLFSEKFDPSTSAAATFFAGKTDGGTCENEVTAPIRLKIVLDKGELLELARWADRQATSIGDGGDIVYLELDGTFIFDLDDGATIKILRKLGRDTKR